METKPEQASVCITEFDHLVLTVADLDKTIAFYEEALGMRAITFGNGWRALEFGHNKINLHEAGREFPPHAARPTPGSVDVCFVTATPLDQVIAHLMAKGIGIEEGPAQKTGASGPITSVYIRDPDSNLIEIASYDSI
jgi:catechol 2,3-dioxygenase-like lactoylglutathione lyase family enzyme